MLKRNQGVYMVVSFGLLMGVLLSVFSSHSVFASSDYNMKTTHFLRLKGSSDAGDCGPEEEWSTRWAEFMSTDTGNPNSYKNNWTYTYNYDQAQSKMDSFHDEFVANLEAGSGWAVQHQKSGYTGTGQAITIYTFDPNATLTVQNSNILVSTGYVHFETFTYNPNAGCRWQAVDYNNNGWNHYIFGISPDAPLFLAASNNIVYPTDYSGRPIPTATPPPLNYVALGDSFSSGEGNPPFEDGTDNSEDQCHRSNISFPRLLASTLYINLTKFVACSGATTENVRNGGLSNEDSQITSLSDNVDLVTMTAGGDDIDFKAFATACTISLCDFGTQIYADTHSKIINELPGKLAITYKALDQATSDKARIYIIGYPNIAPPEMPTGANSACWPLNGGMNNPDSTQNNGAAAYSIQTQLNDTIRQSVSDYNSSKFQYVDPNTSSSPFIGHDWCSQSRYFNVVSFPLPWDPSRTGYSYHPNSLGHVSYASIIKNAIR